ncbi:MAG: branched-chain amino acid ABC transporter permease [Microbacteriaceae bacterium]|nr:branched-chain amino acid ABC transporter permease [Cryobacterium sp.]MBX3104303.1 branched-chain amino acid ABC transporter permease [Cryobacterium sp.]MCC6376140.1 branched-chain amino acid ABC transporter permease [Microbacteriaceae bacterium]
MKRPALLLFAMLIASLALASLAVSPAHADETNTDKYDYIFSGNVKYNDKPLAGVQILVDGGGYSAEVLTDDKGHWEVGVPKKEKYDVTLVESTLPKGVIVAPDERITISDKGATVEAEFGLTKEKSVNFFLGEGVRKVTPFYERVIGSAINGLNFGLMLALASIGLSLIYGTTGISIFSHAEMVTLGAVTTLFFSVFLGWPIWLGIPLALIFSAVVGYGQDVLLWKPLRKRGLSVVQMMIVSIGFSLALRYLFQFFIGGGTTLLPTDPSTTKKLNIFGIIDLSLVDMVSMAISIVVLIAVAYWLLYTKNGKATRAINDNASLSAASGIDVDRVIRLIWILGTVLAGLSGILWAYFRPGIKWDMGWQLLLLIFAAVVLGGLGTAFGALIGSIIIGLLVELTPLWLSADIKYVGALLVLILVLLFRPQGLLGKKERVG